MSANDFFPTSTPTFDPEKRQHGIVIGFDDSENSRVALMYAAELATLRRTRLSVVTVYRLPSHFYANYASLPKHGEDDARKQQAVELLSSARELLTDYDGDVEYYAVEGDSIGALKDISSEAQVTVVGSRGRGGFLGLVMGSVATALPPHAASPVVVVPKEHDPAQARDGSPIVVAGVDGSPAGRTVELHAAQAALERHAVLQILMVMPPPDALAGWYPELVEQSAIDDRRAQYEDWLDSEVAWLQPHYPDLKITRTLHVGDPISEFVECTAHAVLTVVGTRGRGAVAGSVLGSVSRGLLLRKQGPVMVVPELHDARL